MDDKGFWIMVGTFAAVCIIIAAIATVGVHLQRIQEVRTEICDGSHACRVVNVKFYNMNNLPVDSLNAAAERIIKEVNK